ncbi:hypothetical protein [Actinomycetospora soli]|uniref:hypothetical protein n=1 Tax=Actinomycetospora soli TaxID=2893887 RepID=UPI001E3D4803|nr:hypothetical protein [Actinomycetospora soli]MCD2191608.1 hypothetical protein [Actinomycetospora soli]
MLLDQEGQPVLGAVAASIRDFYRALEPLDVATLSRVTQPSSRNEVRTATSSADTRNVLRETMRTTRITHQDEGLVYLGPNGLQIAFGPDTALLYDLILPGTSRAATTAANSDATSAKGAAPTRVGAGTPACGKVNNAITGSSVGVSVLDGRTPCAEARDVVTTYYSMPIPDDATYTLRQVVRGWTCTSTSGAEWQETGRAGDCVKGSAHIAMS